MTITKTFTVIAETICATGHSNSITADIILEDGSPLFGTAFHTCQTCEQPNHTHLTSFHKVEVSA